LVRKAGLILTTPTKSSKELLLDSALDCASKTCGFSRMMELRSGSPISVTTAGSAGSSSSAGDGTGGFVSPASPRWTNEKSRTVTATEVFFIWLFLSWLTENRPNENKQRHERSDSWAALWRDWVEPAWYYDAKLRLRVTCFEQKLRTRGDHSPSTCLAHR